MLGVNIELVKKNAILLITGDVFFILWILLNKVNLLKRILMIKCVLVGAIAFILYLANKNLFMAPFVLIKMLIEMGIKLEPVFVMTVECFKSFINDM